MDLRATLLDAEMLSSSALITACARVTIFRDMSGASLHRRGYRGAMHAAALNEAAAAGVLSLAGWPALCREEGAQCAAPDSQPPYVLR